MKTNRIFKQDVYCREYDSIITSIEVKDGKAVLTLKDTIFFPTGGGQSCDLGTISGLNVVDVYEKGDEIYHIIELPSQAQPPAISDMVHLTIDWNRRFDNMQRHCGEHILSGVFYDLYGGVNRGFHMGDDYMTIDISLEDNPDYGEITWDMAKAAEEKTNRIIWQDLPVTYHHFDTREEAEKMPLRKKLSIERDISIVTVGDPSNPADSVACCGTHPSGAAQVGILKIYKVEPNKGMFRIYFDAGQRAYRKYRNDFEVLTSIEKDLSAGSGDLMEKYKIRQDKNHEIRDRLFNLSKAVIQWEIDDIYGVYSASASSTECCYVREFNHLTIDDLIEIGRALEGRLPKLLFLFHKPDSTLLIFSDALDCGKLVKDNVSVFNGKGGGNKVFARAIFSGEEDAKLFIDALEKLTQ